MWDKRASGGKDYGRIERLRGHVLRRSYPDRAKLLREIAMCLRSCKHVRFAAFMAGQPEDPTRRSAATPKTATKGADSAAQTPRNTANYTHANQPDRGF